MILCIKLNSVICVVFYLMIMACASVAAFDGYWYVDLGTCNQAITLWLKPSKGICVQGSNENECHGWNSDFVQDENTDNWKESAETDYKPAFAVFVTVAAMAGFMFLFSMVTSLFPKLRNQASQIFSIVMAIIISSLALGAAAKTTDTYFTDPDNYAPHCENTNSFAAAGYITGNVCWILGLCIIIFTTFPFCKCLLDTVDDIVDTADRIVTGDV